MPPKAKYTLGRWVEWECPSFSESGDGIIREARYRPYEGWTYLIADAWVTEKSILGEFHSQNGGE